MKKYTRCNNGLEILKVFVKGEKTSEEISKKFDIDPREVGLLFWNK